MLDEIGTLRLIKSQDNRQEFCSTSAGLRLFGVSLVALGLAIAAAAVWAVFTRMDWILPVLMFIPGLLLVREGVRVMLHRRRLVIDGAASQLYFSDGRVVHVAATSSIRGIEVMTQQAGSPLPGYSGTSLVSILLDRPDGAGFAVERAGTREHAAELAAKLSACLGTLPVTNRDWDAERAAMLTRGSERSQLVGALAMWGIALACAVFMVWAAWRGQLLGRPLVETWSRVVCLMGAPLVLGVTWWLRRLLA